MYVSYHERYNQNHQISLIYLKRAVNSCLHECVDIGIGLDVSHLLPPWKLSQHICQHNRNLMSTSIKHANPAEKFASSWNGCMPIVTKLFRLRNRTKATANTLTACREFKRLPDSHLPTVEVILAHIRGNPLRGNLIHFAPIVSDLPRNLLIIHITNLTWFYDRDCSTLYNIKWILGLCGICIL